AIAGRSVEIVDDVGQRTRRGSVAVAKLEKIGAFAAGQLIPAAAAIQPIDVLAAVEPVVAGAAGQAISVGAAQQRIRAPSTVELVVAALAVDQVGTRVTVDRIRQEMAGGGEIVRPGQHQRFDGIRIELAGPEDYQDEAHRAVDYVIAAIENAHVVDEIAGVID